MKYYVEKTVQLLPPRMGRHTGRRQVLPKDTAKRVRVRVKPYVDDRGGEPLFRLIRLVVFSLFFNGCYRTITIRFTINESVYPRSVRPVSYNGNHCRSERPTVYSRQWRRVYRTTR